MNHTYPPQSTRRAGRRFLSQAKRLASGTLSALGGSLCGLLGVVGVLSAVAVPMTTLAAPPAVSPSTATVTVNPTTGAVVYPAARQLVQTFTTAGRAAAVPVAAGQLAWETDGHLLWYGTGTSAGNWAEAVPDASETVEGKVELATQAETETGTDDARAVTPLKLQTKLDGILTDADSGFRISSNGAGGFKLEIWNADQGIYQEIRIAGASGAERIVIAPAP